MMCGPIKEADPITYRVDAFLPDGKFLRSLAWGVPARDINGTKRTYQHLHPGYNIQASLETVPPELRVPILLVD